jgi:hypothetical protein
VLPYARDRAMIQRRGDGNDCVETCEEVGIGHAHFHGFSARCAIRLPGDGHDSTHTLDHEVVARPLGIRPSLAKACNRAVDDLRIDGLQTVIVETVFFQPANLEIFNHYIRFRR